MPNEGGAGGLDDIAVVEAAVEAGVPKPKGVEGAALLVVAALPNENGVVVGAATGVAVDV